MSYHGRNADLLDTWIIERRLDDGWTWYKAEHEPITDAERQWAMRKFDEREGVRLTDGD